MIFTVKTQSLLGRQDIQAVLDSNRNVNLLQMEQADTKRAPAGPKPSPASAFLSMDIEGPRDAKKTFMFQEPSDEEEEGEPGEGLGKKARSDSLDVNYEVLDRERNEYTGGKSGLQKQGAIGKVAGEVTKGDLQFGGSQKNNSGPNSKEKEKGKEFAELDLLGLEMNDPGFQTKELTPGKAKGNHEDTGSMEKLSNKIINRKKEKLSGKKDERQLSGFKEDFADEGKNGSADGKKRLSSDFETDWAPEQEQELMKKQSTSSGKKSGPILLRKDSPSDEENKYVIG